MSSSDLRVGAVNDVLDLAHLAAPYGVQFSLCGQVDGALEALALERGLGITRGRSRIFSRSSLPLFALDVLRWVARLRRCRPDIVHLNYAGYGASLACAAHWCGIPVVSRAGGEYHPRNPANRWIDAYIANCEPQARGLLDSPLADRVVVAGDLFRRDRIDGFTGPTRPLPPRRAGRPRLLFLGQLVERKGLSVLVEAFALSGLDAELLLVGGDWSAAGYPAAVRGQIARLGIGDRVLLEDHRPDAPALLRDCDVFVLPSLSDARPRAIIEAMFLGRPVVATRVGGIPTLVEDGVTGVLVPAGDAQSLAAALVRVVGDPDLRQRLGEAGRSLAEAELRPERTAWRYVELYRRLAASAGGRSSEGAAGLLAGGVDS